MAEAREPGSGFDSSAYDLVYQGAEARVWSGTFLGKPVVVKQRFSKTYRHPTLDAKLTQQRLKAEVRGIVKARKLGIATPVIYDVDASTACLTMECVVGRTLKAELQSPALDAQARSKLLTAAGRMIAKLHDAGLVHGDLTTSNILLRARTDELVLIDFGLSQNSTLPENKGVDLYVFERAFASAHAGQGEAMFEEFLDAYRKSSKFWSATLNRFAEVRTRGRKRTMVG